MLKCQQEVILNRPHIDDDDNDGDKENQNVQFLALRVDVRTLIKHRAWRDWQRFKSHRHVGRVGRV